MPAEGSLGYLLLHGLGVAPDPVAGARLLTNAALGGNVSAQYALGRMAENGDGQPKTAAWAAGICGV